MKYIYELIEGYNKGELRTCATKELPPWYPENLKELMTKGNETAHADLEIIKDYYENMI